jgi:hypothetical protein
VKLKIISLHSHEEGGLIAYTVLFDDLDSRRRMVAVVSKPAFFEPAAHPFCEGFDADLAPQGKFHFEKYDTKALVRIIKKIIRDEANSDARPESSHV